MYVKLLCDSQGQIPASLMQPVTPLVFANRTVLDKRLFVCVKITVLPDVYLASSHLPAPITLSCVPLSFRMPLYILLLMPISLSMTRLSGEARFPINTQAYFIALDCTVRSPHFHQACIVCCWGSQIFHSCFAWLFEQIAKCGILLRENVFLKCL